MNQLALSFKHITPFLANQGKVSRWLSYTGLGVGVLLLLCSIQMYLNINHLLHDKNARKDGADYISVTKVITNENMGKDNRFTQADVKEITQQPFVEDAAPLLANQFRVKASAGNIIPFSTDLFLESVNEKFIDTVPPSFSWQPGQQDVPIIFSSDYLEVYNVFAPSQDLPQLSDKTITAVNIILECHTPDGIQNLRGHIVALSDRINSVLVPTSFMNWANSRYAHVDDVKATRIYIKTKDANDPNLLNYLGEKNYRVNKDKTKFGRVKQVLQAIVSGLALFGILVILLAMVLFSFYLQLMIAKSRENLLLLLTLGFSPKWLSRTVSRKWIPVYITVISSSLLVTALLQYCFAKLVLPGREDLPVAISWMVIAVAITLLILSVVINHRMISKLLNRL